MVRGVLYVLWVLYVLSILVPGKKAPPPIPTAAPASDILAAMLYSILCYDSEDSVCALSQEEDDALMAKLMDVTRPLEDQGRLGPRLGPRLRLMPTAAATTLNASGEVIDGPYAETKEALLGFYILDCETSEEAVEIARKLARQKSWDKGSYEIRPVRWIDAGTLPG